MHAARLHELPSVPQPRSLVVPDARRWFPDLAALAALTTFLYVLFLYPGYTRLFRDSDAGWHIRNGESILAVHRVPDQDPYSFTRAGRPWMAWEWLSDLAAGAAHRAAGLAGVAVLFSGAIAIAVWIWFQLHWKLGSNFLIAAALAIPLLGTTNLHWLARPHVFSWILMLAAVWWMEQEPSPRWVVLYAAGAALWANVHASFLFAPLVALLWTAGRGWVKARYYLAAACLSAVATLANPYGWNLHRHVVSFLADSDLLASVAEFQSFNFHAAGAGQILIALGIAAAGTFAALLRRRFDHFALGLLVLAGGLRSARGLPLVALLLLPIAGAHLSRMCGWRSALEYGDRLRELDRQGSARMLAPLIVLAVFLSAPFIAAHAGFPDTVFPVAASARLEQLAPELFQSSGRLLAPDKFGGYLIYRFEGRLKVFFDGRSDFYGRDFMADYRRLVQVRPGWHDQLERFGFTHALLPNDYSLVDALQRAGWTVLYHDDTATLLKCRT